MIELLVFFNGIVRGFSFPGKRIVPPRYDSIKLNPKNSEKPVLAYIYGDGKPAGHLFIFSRSPDIEVDSVIVPTSYEGEVELHNYWYFSVGYEGREQVETECSIHDADECTFV